MNNLQKAILELHKINNTHCFECLGELNVNITRITKLLKDQEQRDESCKHKLDIAIKALEKIRDVGDTYKDTNLAGYELAVACWAASTISAEEALKELK